MTSGLLQPAPVRAPAHRPGSARREPVRRSMFEHDPLERNYESALEKQDLLNYLWLVFAQQKVNANWGNVRNRKGARAVGRVSH